MNVNPKIQLCLTENHENGTDHIFVHGGFTISMKATAGATVVL